MSAESQYQIRLTPFATPLANQTAADKLFYSFTVPTRVLSMANTVTTQNTVTAAVLALDRRVTYGSDTGRVEVETITIPTTAIIGKVIYSPPIDQEFLPGEQLVIELVTASTAGAGHMDIWVEQTWETPTNLAAGIVSV